MGTGSSWVDVALEERSPRGIVALLALFLGSLVVAAVMAPPVMRLARDLAELWPTRPTLYLAEKELPRYFDRLRWLVVLAGLPWVARAAGIRDHVSLGLRLDGDRWRKAVGWLLVGLAMVGSMSGLQLLFGGARLRPVENGPALLETVLLALLSALFIGVLEELVFRGVVLRAFLQATASGVWAIVLASLFFALVHFQRVPSDRWKGDSTSTTADALVVAWESLRGSVSQIRWDLALGLFLAGSILCLVAMSARSLIPAMALHGGWVWAALVHRRLVETGGGGGVRLWGGRALLDGAAPLALLAVLLAAVALRGKGPPGGES